MEWRLGSGVSSDPGVTIIKWSGRTASDLSGQPVVLGVEGFLVRQTPYARVSPSAVIVARR